MIICLRNMEKLLTALNLNFENINKKRLKPTSNARKQGNYRPLISSNGYWKNRNSSYGCQRVGGRTLFVAHTMELVNQAYNTFKSIWNGVSVRKFADSVKDYDSHVICGSIQSVALNLDSFKDDDFDYIIIDEAHHATADTYQKF